MDWAGKLVQSKLQKIAMGGGGSAIEAMMSALRMNRAILKTRRKAFDKNPHKEELHHRELHFKEATPEEIAAFKQKLQAEKRRERLITGIIYAIGLAVLS